MRGTAQARSNADAVWTCVRNYRGAVADAFDQMTDSDLRTESWCKGWDVGDVLSHLVYLAEASVPSVARDVLGAFGNFDRAMDRGARRLACLPAKQLAARLRAASDGRFHVPGTPAAVALGEVLVHAADALRPLGRGLVVKPEHVLTVIDIYVRIGHRAFHSGPHRGLRLVASDTDWSSGTGREVRGRAIDLLLLTANRRQILPVLEGPGARDVLLGTARGPRGADLRRRSRLKSEAETRRQS